MSIIKLIREGATAEDKQAKALTTTAKSTVRVNREVEKDLRIQRRKRSDSHRRQQTRRASARTQASSEKQRRERGKFRPAARKNENRTWKTKDTITLEEFIGTALSVAGGAVGGALKGAGKIVGGAARGTRRVVGGAADLAKGAVSQGTSTVGRVLKTPKNIITGTTSAKRKQEKAAKELAAKQAKEGESGGIKQI